MTKKNPFKKAIASSSIDLSKLDEIEIPGETITHKHTAPKKVYDTPFTASITKDTHTKIMFVKNHPDPDIKRKLGVIIEQAVDLYLKEKGITL